MVLDCIEKPPLSFKATKPTDTLYHKVKILIKTTNANTFEISIPCKLKRPARLPSVTPIPPGINENAPRISEDT